MLILSPCLAPVQQQHTGRDLDFLEGPQRPQKSLIMFFNTFREGLNFLTTYSWDWGF